MGRNEKKQILLWFVIFSLEQSQSKMYAVISTRRRRYMEMITIYPTLILKLQM